MDESFARKVFHEKMECSTTDIVSAESVSDFLDRYYKPDRYKGRGEVYAQNLLEKYEKDLEENGFVWISHHDSITGRTVEWLRGFQKRGA